MKHTGLLFESCTLRSPVTLTLQSSREEKMAARVQMWSNRKDKISLKPDRPTKPKS